MFSRAKLEKFSQAGNRDAVVSQALRVIKKNGGADVQGTGGELGEVLPDLSKKAPALHPTIATT